MEAALRIELRSRTLEIPILTIVLPPYKQRLTRLPAGKAGLIRSCTGIVERVGEKTSVLFAF